jgi:rRNA pseudouridine-1189 N-methylase Emg1 (Nep1/Mra1 family)
MFKIILKKTWREMKSKINTMETVLLATAIRLKNAEMLLKTKKSRLKEHIKKEKQKKQYHKTYWKQYYAKNKEKLSLKKKEQYLLNKKK